MKFYSIILITILFFSEILSQDIYPNYEKQKNTSIHSEISELSKILIYKEDEEQTNLAIGTCYLKVKKYSDALFHLYKVKNEMQENITYQLLIYELGLLSNNKLLADEAFEKYIQLCPTELKNTLTKEMVAGLETTPITHRLMTNERELTSYFPYIIEANHIQLLNRVRNSTITSALDFVKYLTDVYTSKDSQFVKSNTFTQVDKQNGYKYGPFSINRNQSKVYVTRWDEKNQRISIYLTKRSKTNKNAQWKKFSRLKFENEEYSKNFLHPMLSYNETKLIFCSNKSNGFGGYDLWIGDFKNDSAIVNIRNLGAQINTPGDECFPSIIEKNLFFASNGHYGYGNLDIYKSNYKNGEYFNTINMGSGINSSADDYALFFNSKNHSAYFTSNRNSGKIIVDQIFKANIPFYLNSINMESISKR